MRRLTFGIRLELPSLRLDAIGLAVAIIRNPMESFRFCSLSP